MNRKQTLWTLGSVHNLKGQGGIISGIGRLLGSGLTSCSWIGGSLAGAGIVREGGGVVGADLNSCSVLQSVLACLHLKRHCPNPHRPPLVSPFSLVGRVGPGPPAGHAAGHEEGHGYKQQKRSDDDEGVAGGEVVVEGENSQQGDVDASQHDAQATGTAQGRGGQALVLQGPLPGGRWRSRRFLIQRQC